MGATHIAHVPRGFSCSDLQVNPVRNVFSFSASTPQFKPGCMSRPQTHTCFSQKRSHARDMAQSFVFRSLGMGSEVCPMVCQKTAMISGGMNYLPCLGGFVPRRDLCLCASVIQSSTVEPQGNCRITESEEIPSQSDRKGSANEGRLPYGLCPSLMPRHVAIIMDGNSRWAEKRGLPATAGYEAGTRALTEIVKLSCKWGIQILTVFAFSTDNWSRPKTEVDFLMSLLESVIEGELENLKRLNILLQRINVKICVKRENIQVYVIGDSSGLPNSLQRLIAQAVESTEQNSGLKFIVAVSYSGRQDIVQASRQLAGRVEAGQLKATDITETLFEEELETSCVGSFGSPDLLIRTSGELRLSNFLLWQLAYTELFFDESFWPEFGEAQYVKALQSFQHRHRRFGKRICNTAEDGTL